MDIDLVIPMVFPQDKEWQREYARCCGGNADGVEANVRFRSWGTEELLVKCVMKYMPWVRTIHLLLASESQVQGWMTAQPPNPLKGEYGKAGALPFREGSGVGLPELRLVFHREFIPAEYLPCFSSPCIEMFLHRIPGLSETFIYGNDDVFPLSPLEEGDFFRSPTPSPSPKGLGGWFPCQRFTERAFPASPNSFHQACMGQLNMLAADFGKTFRGTWLRSGHCMSAMLKSTCEEVWQKYGEKIREHLSPLRRSERDFNQYLYSLYQHFTGRYVNHSPRQQYVGAGIATEKIAGMIRDPQCGIVCMNDNRKITDWERRAEIVHKEIENKLNNQNKMDVLIIHYNTQELTEAAIRSLWKHTPDARVTVFDNSDKRPFSLDELIGLNGRIEIIDNTKGQHIDFEKWLDSFTEKDPTNDNRYASARHCKSVDYCMDLFPDGFLLMDSDVLVKQDVSPLFDDHYVWVGKVKLQGTRYRVRLKRVLPYLCYINTKMCKEQGIRFCNDNKMYGLSMRKPDTAYDTGCWFFEVCNVVKLPVKEMPIDDFILHLGHASWQDRKAAKWLKDNRNLWNDGVDGLNELGGLNENVKIYICTHTDFKAVVHHKAYEVVDARQWNGDHCENGLRGSFYSELITYKHIAERKELPAYVGFCAYRKYFSFLDNVPDMGEIFKEYDAIAATPLTVKPDVKGQYARSHNVKDLDIVTDIVRRDYPDLWPVYERSLHQPSLYACNMFIVKREDFLWLMQTVFEILDKYLAAVMPAGEAAIKSQHTGQMGEDPIDRRIQSHPRDYHIGCGKIGVLPYQYRIGGFLGERVVNALLRYRFQRIKHYDKVITAESLPQNK